MHEPVSGAAPVVPLAGPPARRPEYWHRGSASASVGGSIGPALLGVDGELPLPPFSSVDGSSAFARLASQTGFGRRAGGVRAGYEATVRSPRSAPARSFGSRRRPARSPPLPPRLFGASPRPTAARVAVDTVGDGGGIGRQYSKQDVEDITNGICDHLSEQPESCAAIILDKIELREQDALLKIKHSFGMSNTEPRARANLLEGDVEASRRISDELGITLTVGANGTKLMSATAAFARVVSGAKDTVQRSTEQANIAQHAAARMEQDGNSDLRNQEMLRPHGASRACLHSGGKATRVHLPERHRCSFPGGRIRSGRRRRADRTCRTYVRSAGRGSAVSTRCAEAKRKRQRRRRISILTLPNPWESRVHGDSC